MAQEPGRLYVVSTPIGNLGDFSARGVETLSSVSAVLAEDTRHSRHLLDRYGVRTPLESFHEHNEARATPRIIERLLAGESLALIADAGTPLLSDPGARLINAAIEARVPVTAIPGPSALLAALVVSGLPTDRFTFYGFLPRKGRERGELIREIVRHRWTVVLYEAPTRVAATLAELERAGAGSRRVALARELTKQFEEVRRGTVEELARYYEGSPPRGEVVIVLAGETAPARPNVADARERARAMLAAGASARDVAQTLIAEHGIARNIAYRVAQEAHAAEE